MPVGAVARDVDQLADMPERTVGVVERGRDQRSGRKAGGEQLHVVPRPGLRQQLVDDRRRPTRISAPRDDECLVRQPELQGLQAACCVARTRDVVKDSEQLIPAAEVEEHPRRLGLRPPERALQSARLTEGLKRPVQLEAFRCAH